MNQEIVDCWVPGRQTATLWVDTRPEFWHKALVSSDLGIILKSLSPESPSPTFEGSDGVINAVNIPAKLQNVSHKVTEAWLILYGNLKCVVGIVVSQQESPCFHFWLVHGLSVRSLHVLSRLDWDFYGCSSFPTFKMCISYPLQAPDQGSPMTRGQSGTYSHRTSV